MLECLGSSVLLCSGKTMYLWWKYLGRMCVFAYVSPLIPKQKQPFKVLLSVSLFPSSILGWEMIINDICGGSCLQGLLILSFSWESLLRICCCMSCVGHKDAFRWDSKLAVLETACALNAGITFQSKSMEGRQTLSLYEDCWRLPTVWFEVSRMFPVTRRRRII